MPKHITREPMHFAKAFPDDAERLGIVEPPKEREPRLPVAPRTPEPPIDKNAPQTITGLVRKVKGTQFQLWDCPVGNWYRNRNPVEAQIITTAFTHNQNVTVEVEGKIVKGIKLT